MLYCSLNASLEVAPRNRFFFFRLHRKEMHYGVYVSTIISCICVCVLYCYYSIMYLQTKFLDVCFLLLFAALYTYGLNC
jgi:Mg/Co/Ni transporter MgtE